MTPKIKGFVIAGTNSGAGKTTIAIGLMAALVRRGLTVAPFKVGPDFIDPGHHARMTGKTGRNLDGWMLSQAYNLACFHKHAAGADVAVVEGVMGVFDGFSGDSEAGSTAQMAKWLGLPAILVVDAASMARSVAALVQGFVRFDPELSFAGVIFNNLGSKGHLDYLKRAMEAYVDLPVLGGIARDERLRMPERHLGLITAEDLLLPDSFRDMLADQIETSIDLDGLLADLPEIPVVRPDDIDRSQPAVSSEVRLGLAQDNAFCFYYADNLDLLESAGARVVPFSPLADSNLPEDLDGLYFGGGYPELHAAKLAANTPLRHAVLRCSRAGMPIYAECGGFMYLCTQLKDHAGQEHPMCGCFPFQTRMHQRLRTLGYREISVTADTLIGKRGALLRGHEFHYSDIGEGDLHVEATTAYRVNGRKGHSPKKEGYLVRRTLGSYVHLHFGSHPESAGAFVEACRMYRREREKYKTQQR